MNCRDGRPPRQAMCNITMGTRSLSKMTSCFSLSGKRLPNPPHRLARSLPMRYLELHRQLLRRQTLALPRRAHRPDLHRTLVQVHRRVPRRIPRRVPLQILRQGPRLDRLVQLPSLQLEPSQDRHQMHLRVIRGIRQHRLRQPLRPPGRFTSLN